MSKDNVVEQKEKTPTPLSVMLGEGGELEAKGKIYTVKPIAIKDVSEFMKDEMSVGTQFFALINEKSRAKIDRWLGGKKDKDGKIIPGYCYDENGNPVTLKDAEDNDWDIVDLREFIKKLCDFSG